MLCAIAILDLTTHSYDLFVFVFLLSILSSTTQQSFDIKPNVNKPLPIYGLVSSRTEQIPR
jgi:hypothetical protein